MGGGRKEGDEEKGQKEGGGGREIRGRWWRAGGCGELARKNGKQFIE